MELATVSKSRSGWSVGINLAVVATCAGTIWQARDVRNELQGALTEQSAFIATTRSVLEHIVERVGDLDATRDQHRVELLRLATELARMGARQEMIMTRIDRIESAK
jgi:hypothetical protein